MRADTGSLMRDLVTALAAPECEGRAPGTAGGIRARRLVIDALRAAGAAPMVQPIAAGANVLATIPGTSGRWVMVGAHYDHVGIVDGELYPGADDNASGVAVLVEVARALAGERLARGVVIAVFDAEEPPHFGEATMGSQAWARRPTVPLDDLDLMICLDIVGHALGPPGTPAAVRQTLLALGAERSLGTGAMVDRLAQAEPGVIVRRLDAEIIPTLSDYDAFWRRRIPFVFLSCGRDQRYHTPQDTPDALDFSKMAATARWLVRFVRETCERPEERIAWVMRARDDRSTLRTLIELTDSLAAVAPLAGRLGTRLRSLEAECGPDGRLPVSEAQELQTLAGLLEQGLA